MRPNLAVLNFWCYPCIYEDIYTEVSGKKPGEINTNVLNTDFPILSILIRNKPGKTRFNEKERREKHLHHAMVCRHTQQKMQKGIWMVYNVIPVLHQNSQVQKIHQDKGLTQKKIIILFWEEKSGQC